jgi:flagellar biosynthesis/type III secretory pathway protein FliH
VAEAKAQREKLIAGAADEGRKIGIAQGIEEGRRIGEQSGREAVIAEERQHLQQLQSAWGEALIAFQDDRDRLLLDAKDDVIRMACAIAERITKRAVELEPDRVMDQLVAVLSLLTRPTRVTIAVSPDDHPLVEEAMPALVRSFASSAHAEIVRDAELRRGSVVLKTAAGGQIEASIQAQFDRIVQTLLPSRQTGSPAADSIS